MFSSLLFCKVLLFQILHQNCHLYIFNNHLIAQNVEINIEGRGNCEITVINNLDLNIVGKTTSAGDYQLYTKELQEKGMFILSIKTMNLSQ